MGVPSRGGKTLVGVPAAAESGGGGHSLPEAGRCPGSGGGVTLSPGGQALSVFLFDVQPPAEISAAALSEASALPGR